MFNDVLFLAKQQINFRGDNEDINSHNRANCLAKLGSVFEFNLHRNNQFIGSYSEIVNNANKKINSWAKGVLI